MNISRMRQIDRWIGPAACFLLTTLRKLNEFGRRSESQTRKIRKILFVKPAEQGATVLAYPAMKWAIRYVGQENVYFLVFQENRFILDAMQVVPAGNVLDIPTDSFIHFARGCIQALHRARRLKIDAAVDLEFFSRASAILTYLSGAVTRVGLHRFADAAPYRGDLMTHRIRFDPDIHTGQLFTSMTQAISLSPADLSGAILAPPAPDAALPAFAPFPEELERMKTMLVRHGAGVAGVPLVLLNPNASDMLPLRRWPSERYVELAKRLIGRSSSVRVAFTGSPQEAKATECIALEVASDRCFSVAGMTTLRELLALYCSADVLVTNDSGPAHFASLTPIQVVVLFGPETPARFGSLSPRTRTLYAQLHCSPCVNAFNNRLSSCTDNQCMKQITVSEVFENVCQMAGL